MTEYKHKPLLLDYEAVYAALIKDLDPFFNRKDHAVRARILKNFHAAVDVLRPRLAKLDLLINQLEEYPLCDDFDKAIEEANGRANLATNARRNLFVSVQDRLLE